MRTGSKRRKPRRWLRRIRRLAVLGALLVILGAVGFSAWVWSQVRSSLPLVEGELTLAGLSAPVSIERDGRGVPLISGRNRLDVARATGFVHAQERFFQMDSLRRLAAGEVSEILGFATVGIDRRIRLHRFRMRARQAVERAPSRERNLLQAYAQGVNAGLEALGGIPFEYAVLLAEPAPWKPEDSFLAAYAMYLQLQDSSGVRESALGLLYDTLPQQLADFLAPPGTSFDAPLDGLMPDLPPAPGPDVFDLRATPSIASSAESSAPRRDDLSHPWLWSPRRETGSNNWAVAASRMRHGGALLANDMHLGITLPNTWYLASLRYQDQGLQRTVTGVTLPGTPVVVAGSNGSVAWGLTNSYGDWSDLVMLESPEGDSDSYLTPDGPRPFDRHEELIRVRLGRDQALEILSTIWGPVIDRDHEGRRRAYRWAAHDENAVSLDLMMLESAQDLDQALAVANRGGAPAQNFVVADSQGRVGWTIAGAIPRRAPGFSGRLPQSWADGSRGWMGWLKPEEHPRIVDPADGLIWTANARVVGGEMLARIGDGGYAMGARAAQIRDGLRALGPADESDMLRIQLDDRALFLQRWRDLLLDTLGPEAQAADERRREAKAVIEGWEGRAAIESVSFRLVRSFHRELSLQVFDSLTAACRSRDPGFRFSRTGRQGEHALWTLVQERPLHLLSPRFESWEEQILAALDAVLDRWIPQGGSLSGFTWGEANRSQVRHPLSLVLPLPGLSQLLDMPSQPLPGASDMPRVQGRLFGASQRLAVSPGREEQGIFHMPGGQSGHPLSAHYGDMHSAWAQGQAAPLLPGPSQNKLLLKPR